MGKWHRQAMYRLGVDSTDDKALAWAYEVDRAAHELERLEAEAREALQKVGHHRAGCDCPDCAAYKYADGARAAAREEWGRLWENRP